MSNPTAAKLIVRCLTVVVLTTSIAGCANRAIFRHQPIDDGKPTITTVDAKQRAVLSTVKSEQEIRRFCSEPSPDVFSVVAQAFSANGSLGKNADPSSVEAALGMAFSSAEQGSSIQRTQTINMLRELMFRTCERYLNGAYNELEMSIQAIRDQRLMVSILAIEQLTGAVTPKPVVIGATGTTSGAGDLAIVKFDDSAKAVGAAEKAKSKAQENWDTVNDTSDKKVCDAIAKKVEKKEDLSDTEKPKKLECDGAKTSLLSATEHLTKVNAHHADLKKLASSAGLGTAASTSATAPGGIDRAHAEAVKDVAQVVKEIVLESFSDDTEIMLFCVKTLTDQVALEGLDEPLRKSLQSECMSYVKERTYSEKARLASERLVTETKMRLTANSRFETYWKGRLEDLKNKGTQAEDLAKIGLNSSDLTSATACFTAATDKAALETCFSHLTVFDQKRLLKAIPGGN